MKEESKAMSSAHAGLGNLTNKLEELWLEIGGTCHLHCPYCFASSDGIDDDPNNLKIETVIKAIKEFASMGGKRLGIVGAGEPFHSQNIKDLFEILDSVYNTEIITTIFTTGDLLSNQILDHLENYPDITLLIKFNSFKPEIQDRLAGNVGYNARRDAALGRLITRGYNDGHRLGIVTSVMEDNKNEIVELLRFARKNNIIFDADTLIPRGRGGTCGLSTVPEETKKILLECQKVDAEEFGYSWNITSSYIASPPCTRFCCHLYIDKTGTVHPCVSSYGVVLGNIKDQSLLEIWEGEIAKIIRNHKYVGKCTTCLNYKTKKCFSCLGRACTEVTTKFLEDNGCVKTVGCFNYIPIE